MEYVLLVKLIIEIEVEVNKLRECNVDIDICGTT
jgi:hypothetical protein